MVSASQCSVVSMARESGEDELTAIKEPKLVVSVMAPGWADGTPPLRAALFDERDRCRS